jgi:hypothetical protein
LQESAEVASVCFSCLPESAFRTIGKIPENCRPTTVLSFHFHLREGTTFSLTRLSIADAAISPHRRWRSEAARQMAAHLGIAPMTLSEVYKQLRASSDAFNEPSCGRAFGQCREERHWDAAEVEAVVRAREVIVVWRYGVLYHRPLCIANIHAPAVRGEALLTVSLAHLEIGHEGAVGKRARA